MSFLMLINRKYRDIYFVENILTAAIALFLIIYIGFRDPWIGVDTQAYIDAFYNKEFDFATEKDIIFGLLRSFFYLYFDVSAFLICCSFIYIGFALFSFYKIFNKRFSCAFLLFLISPSFIMLGINVIRSGMAASIFLLAISMHNTKWKFCFLLVSVLMHISMIIPVILYLFFLILDRKKWNVLGLCYLFWVFSLILAFFNVNIIPLVSSYVIDLFNDRVSGYLMDSKYNTTFFSVTNLFYALPVIFSFYYVFNKKNVDAEYLILLEIYIVINGLFLLFLHMPFSERIGYLSSFLFPILCFYPYLICDSRKKECFYVSIFTLCASFMKLVI